MVKESTAVGLYEHPMLPTVRKTDTLHGGETSPITMSNLPDDCEYYPQYAG
jgi:hypothetical protein